MEMIDKCSACDCFMDFISQFADPLNALKTVFLLHSPIKQNHFTNTALGWAVPNLFEINDFSFWVPT